MSTNLKSQPDSLFIGVDVGTGGVRAALVDVSGTVLRNAQQPIDIYEPKPGYYEQSSANIWEACVAVVKTVVQDVSPEQIKGIGFDATCSLVVLDADFKPVTVSPTGDDERNIVMWMDHRAEDQANTINATEHEVLDYVGGKMSLEMEPPKLLWLKQMMPDSWSRAEHFFDLADYMTWKATGETSRSLCNLVCKWAYQASPEGGGHWEDSFWQQIGLGDLTENNHAKIGNKVLVPGEPVGNGLSDIAAKELGLFVGTAVGTGMIDAHAGGLGMIACNMDGFDLPCQNQPITSRLPIICGTSSCHMAVSQDSIFVPGVWGPYYSAMVPGLWLNEGGQSITGKLIDHVINTHPAFHTLEEKASESGVTVYECLHQMLETIATTKQLKSPAFLTKDVHMWPDYHGNRSPVADSTLKGMISGLTLSTSMEDLAVMYMATLQALAHGTKFIIDTMEASGHSISTLFACGGLSKNPLFVQVHADITGLPIVLPKESESVLVGAAILGAAASKHYSNVQEAMKAMSHAGAVVCPDTELKDYYAKKYRVYWNMLDHQREYRKIMEGL